MLNSFAFTPDSEGEVSTWTLASHVWALSEAVVINGIIDAGMKDVSVSFLFFRRVLG